MSPNVWGVWRGQGRQSKAWRCLVYTCCQKALLSFSENIQEADVFQAQRATLESHNLCPTPSGSGPSTLPCVQGIQEETHELFWVLRPPGQMLQSLVRFYSGCPAHMPFSHDASAPSPQDEQRGHTQGTFMPLVPSPGSHPGPPEAPGVLPLRQEGKWDEPGPRRGWRPERQENEEAGAQR